MNLFRKCVTVALGMLTLCTVGCKPVSEIPTPAPTQPTTSTEAPLAKEATVKIMSWNILNPSWGGGPVDNRADSFVNTIKAEMPDVFGLQEASQKWHDKFASLPETYVPVNMRTDADKAAMTMFFYNAQKLTLIESGIEDLDKGSDIRIVSWAVFQVKDTAVKFLLTNTHPDSRSKQCLEHTRQYIEIVQKLYKEKGLPLLSVGDFNATESSASYLLHTSDGFTDAKYADGVTLLNDADSYLQGDYGGTVTTGKGSRDHLFFKGDVTPVTFTTLVTDDTLIVSDHLPIIGDVTIRV